ncbi:uncharacterized protein LOC142317960 [Lycorma delicatula]|uniref:uncharacterized protein LOC142317960 n=1 Tax=Lycorma delicatula TaxID=130591 RepID=UPI003F50EDE7
MKSNELRIKDFHTVKTKDGMVFYPCRVIIDKLTIKGSNFIKGSNCNFNLKQHLNIHTKEKNYICNFCQKSFNHKTSLKIHLNIHTKEKNYICNICQKSFNRKTSLKRHLNIHTKEMNYICNFCQKSFNHKTSLKIHLNIHTKEKNYISDLETPLNTVDNENLGSSNCHVNIANKNIPLRSKMTRRQQLRVKFV